MRILGADVPETAAGERVGPVTLVALDGDGRVTAPRQALTPADLARLVLDTVDDEPFVLGVGLPVAASRGPRSRAVDNLVRRRLGYRLPSGARAGRRSASAASTGDALLTALAGAGHPCLPYPDRDRRRSGLAEIWPRLVLKSILWQGSAAAAAPSHPDRESALRAYAPPAYRIATAPRAGWAERAASLDVALRALARRDDLDVKPAWDALATAASDREVEWAGGLLDATLIAATARRYLEEPETCAFLGDRERGYVILPADAFLRRLALREPLRGSAGRLFPTSSLRARLAAHATVRPLELVEIPGRPARLEATFSAEPAYEFDNVDEMLWWKHCRHLDGPEIPVDGLLEMAVRLGPGRGDDEPTGGLRLLRSRHKVLSFRFEPPAVWRARIATRDGRTYPFRIARAIFEAT